MRVVHEPARLHEVAPLEGLRHRQGARVLGDDVGRPRPGCAIHEIPAGPQQLFVRVTQSAKPRAQRAQRANSRIARRPALVVGAPRELRGASRCP